MNFSRRFWSALVVLDADLQAAQRLHRASHRRLVFSRAAVTMQAQEEFWLEYQLCLEETRAAVSRLVAFRRAHAPIEGRSHRYPELRPDEA